MGILEMHYFVSGFEGVLIHPVPLSMPCVNRTAMERVQRYYLHQPYPVTANHRPEIPVLHTIKMHVKTALTLLAVGYALESGGLV